MKFPGCKARTINSTVGLIDIVPTILQYLGLKLPDILEGKALDVSSGSLMAHGPVFSETFNSQIHRSEHVEPIAFRSVVLGNHKLIYDQKKDSKQIYDLDKDPQEKNDLSGQNNEQNRKLEILLSRYMKTRKKPSSTQDANELFTPEQKEQLKSLGYL